MPFLVGGSHDVLAAVLLLGAVQLLVVVHDQVRPVGDPESVDASAVLDDLVDLLAELLQVDHDAVADDGQLAGPDDS